MSEFMYIDNLKDEIIKEQSSKIIELESDKAELIEAIKTSINNLTEKGLNWDFYVGCEIDDLKKLLKKHGVKI